MNTNKKDAVKLVEFITRRLTDETFFQFNMVGTDWLFITTNKGTYNTITTDKIRNQFYINSINKYSGTQKQQYFNVTRHTMDAVHNLLEIKQKEYVYGII